MQRPVRFWLFDHEQGQSSLALVQALASNRREPLVAWLDAHCLSMDHVRWLHKQGLALYAFYLLQRRDLLDRIPEDVLLPWQTLYYEAATICGVQDWEIERILDALAREGVAFVWLKGAALAYTVYPDPVLRHRGDLDLWVLPEQLPVATRVLDDLSYRFQDKEARPRALAYLAGGELQMVNNGAALSLVELQWPAIRCEWIRHTTAVDHAGIWARRVPGVLDRHDYCTMAPEDTLLHLCIHQAINHQFGSPWLRNLLDVHMVVERYDLDWSLVAARATDWRLATVIWTVLDLAQRLLRTPVPADFLNRLAPSPIRRYLIGGLHLDRALVELWPGGYRHRRFLIQLLLVDRLRDAARLIGRAIYPEASWLRARYGVEPGSGLWRVRLAHVGQLAISARA